MSKSLSIVIPVYNEASRLAACLQSIADQSEAPEDVIVIDNNSTDNSLSIAQQFPFVRVIHEKRQGIVYARNAGFDAVQADIIARIDADSTKVDFGLEVTIVTKTKNREKAIELYKELGVPLKFKI